MKSLTRPIDGGEVQQLKVKLNSILWSGPEDRGMEPRTPLRLQVEIGFENATADTTFRWEDIGVPLT